MKDILFRGKRIDNGEWVEGYYYQYKRDDNGEQEHCILQDNPGGFSDFKIYYVDPETVGQYTGLTDKNGVKIFEGDILHYADALTNHSYTGVVQFKDGSFMINGKYVKGYRWMDYECEVIGNAFDNPELMQEDAQ